MDCVGRVAHCRASVAFVPWVDQWKYEKGRLLAVRRLRNFEWAFLEHAKDHGMN